MKYIDEEERAKKVGFRNFTSFVSIMYYCNKLSLKEGSEILGVSSTKFKKAIIKRGFELRQPGPVRGKFLRDKKRRKGLKKKGGGTIWKKVQENTSFIFPWCALYIYYEKYQLTSYEISGILKVSQTLVCKFLKEYNIKLRKQGQKKIREEH